MISIDLLNNSTSKGLLRLAEQFERCLTPLGRLNLLGVALRIATEKEAIAICDAFLSYHSAGHPISVFLNIYDDARWHASIATPVERKSYCFAHYQAMAPHDQARFQAYINNNREAA